MTIVAASTSKSGGPCRDCGKYIARGGLIFKIAESGPSHSKNGPGRWVCRECSNRYEEASHDAR